MRVKTVGQALLPVRFRYQPIAAAIRRRLSLVQRAQSDRQECLFYSYAFLISLIGFPFQNFVQLSSDENDRLCMRSMYSIPCR